MATSRGAVLLGCATLVWACSGGSPAQPRPLVEHDFEPLTRLIQQTLDTLDFADSAALILLQDGQAIYEGEFGALTLDSEVPLASAAKLLTATTVLAVVDDGSLALDSRMDDYLPENFYRGPGGSGKEAITIRQLLSLVSGIPHDSSVHLPGQQDSPGVLARHRKQVASGESRGGLRLRSGGFYGRGCGCGSCRSPELESALFSAHSSSTRSDSHRVPRRQKSPAGRWGPFLRSASTRGCFR